MKAKLHVVTVLEFDCKEDVGKFANSPDVSRITGFREEILAALVEARRVQVSTPKPPYGRLAVSEIYIEWGDDEKLP